MRTRTLRRRYGRSGVAAATQFKHLLNGAFFKFVEDETNRPVAAFAPTYVKTSERSYVNSSAPTIRNERGGYVADKHIHRASLVAHVRQVPAYATHAFPHGDK